MINSVYWSSCKGPVILARFSRNLNFLDVFSKNISNFIKIRPLGAELGSMRTNGQADMTKLIVALRHFAKAPKNRTNERPFLKRDCSPVSQAP